MTQDNHQISIDTLWDRLEVPGTEPRYKQTALLFHNASEDWPESFEYCQDYLNAFVQYFGKDLKIEKIKGLRFDGNNAWQMEASSSLVEIFELWQPEDDTLEEIIANTLSYFDKIEPNE